ncbi:MAG: hypothetical protein GY929_01175 [Actinomycetia bacterium]|nr:hypothetical protein [Actinomycetes bacterium]
MSAVLDLFGRVANDVWSTVTHTWIFVVISVVAAAAMTVYVGTDRLSRMLRSRQAVAVAGAVLVATLTPFCSCGTTAVLLGMMATTAPWAPLVAFVVSSPLTSPSELVFSAGLFGWSFALLLFIGTMVLGLSAGWVAGILDRMGWLEGQARMEAVSGAGNCDTSPGGTDSCSIDGTAGSTGAVLVVERVTTIERLRLGELGREIVSVGRRLVMFFLGFTALSYLMIELLPTSWITNYVGDDSAWAVPIGALLGLPAYLNSEASLPMVAGLMEGGMGPGAAMAFTVTGAGTSVGAMTGLLVIARSRVVALCVGVLFVGAVVLGTVAQVTL